MITHYPEQVKVLLRFKGKRVYSPGEIISKDELEKNFKLPNINGLIWNNQIEVVDSIEDTVSEEDVSTGAQPVTPQKRGRKKQ